MGDKEVEEPYDYIGELTNKGAVVPRDAGVVYLYELQNASHTFRGFSVDELAILYEAFSIVSFGPGVQIIEKGHPASYVAIILQGMARTYQKQGPHNSQEHTIDNLEKGDFIGQNAFFESKDGDFVEHQDYVKVTGCVNVLMIFSYEQLTLLNSVNPHCGNRMMRLTAEAASERIYAPTGVPSHPYPEAIVNKPDIRSILTLFWEKENSLIEGLNDKEVDLVMDHAGVVSYQRGQQVFFAGHQARVLLLLLSGQVETRGSSACMFTTPGDVIGESMFPFIIHKADAYASKNSVFLAFTCESIYALNKKHSTLGFKLTKNIIRGTLAKMQKVFRPGGIAYDPERVDLSKMEKEMVELKWVSTEGMYSLLKSAHTAMSGKNETSALEVHNFSGRTAVRRLNELLENLGNRILEQEKQMSGMVQRKDFQKMSDTISKHEHTEAELRRTVKMKDNRIESLEFSIREVEAKCSKLENKLTNRAKDIEEIEGQLSKEKEASRQQWKRMHDHTVEMRRKMVDSDSVQSDGVWTIVMKEQAKQIDDLKQTLSQHEETISELTYNNKNLNQELVRMRKASELQEISAKEAGEADEALMDEYYDDSLEEGGREGSGGSGFELVDETIPRLQRELARALKTRALARWASIVNGLRNKAKGTVITREVLKSMQEFRGRVEEGIMFKGMAEDLQVRCAELETLKGELQSRLSLVEGNAQEVQDALQKRSGEVSKIPEMQMVQMKVNQMEMDARRHREAAQNLARQLDQERATLRETYDDLDKTGQLATWFAKVVLEFEATDKPAHILWRSNEVNLLKSAWAVLTRRKYLQSPLNLYDMDAIAAVLLRRGVEEFEGVNSPLTSMAFMKNCDGLAELLHLSDSPTRLPHALGRCATSMGHGGSRTAGTNMLPRMTSHGPGERSASMTDTKARRRTHQYGDAFEDHPPFPQGRKHSLPNPSLSIEAGSSPKTTRFANVPPPVRSRNGSPNKRRGSAPAISLESANAFSMAGWESNESDDEQAEMTLDVEEELTLLRERPRAKSFDLRKTHTPSPPPGGNDATRRGALRPATQSQHSSSSRLTQSLMGPNAHPSRDRSGSHDQLIGTLERLDQSQPDSDDEPKSRRSTVHMGGRFTSLSKSKSNKPKKSSIMSPELHVRFEVERSTSSYHK